MPGLCLSILECLGQLETSGTGFTYLGMAAFLKSPNAKPERKLDYPSCTSQHNSLSEPDRIMNCVPEDRHA